MVEFKKVKKKPIIVDAFQLTESFWDDYDNDYPLSINGRFIYAHSVNLKKSSDIETLEGVMEANIGDWVIKGVKGEIYPCRKDIFEETYEDTSN